MAGYSGTPLIRKIGIKPGHRIHLRDNPETFLRDLGELPEAVRFEDRLAADTDVMICFVESEADLRKQFGRLPGKLASDGMLWIAWPKRASGRQTDLTEDVVRSIGLKAGLVDVKVCAIDEVWSGLKFVIRLKDRAKKYRAKNGQPTAAKGKKSVSPRVAREVKSLKEQ
jgi:hypothetical protein